MQRMAKVKKSFGTDWSTIQNYMPANYTVVDEDNEFIYISGFDHCGWTLDEYVLPRLASGMHFGEEIHV